MKMTHAVTMASTLLLAAGCAHEQRHEAQYDQSIAPGFATGQVSEPNRDVSSTSTTTTYSTSVNGGAAVSGDIGAGGSQSDNAIVAQVRESFQRDPEIALIVPNIQISANNGAIILNGSVQSDEQSRQIESMAKHTSGVVAVNNQLKVISGQRPAGMENSNNSQLNLTGNSDADASQHLYKESGQDADSSTNSVLNPTSLPDSGSKIYRENSQEQTGQNESNGQLQNTNNVSNTNSSQMP